MTDYYSPTVVDPFLPVDDITPLERLILGLSYDEEPAGPGLVYFHSWCGPSGVVSVGAGALKQALEASRDTAGVINDHVARYLAEHDSSDEPNPVDDIEIDLTGPEDFNDLMFRDIVRRSSTIEEIVITQAFTCTKMRIDGFGGAVIRITAEAIQYRSTHGMLEEMRVVQTPSPALFPDTSGHETRSRLEALAGEAGWDSYTLLLLIARWADTQRQAEDLIGYLDRLAAARDE
jgi:hypothetical protein